MTKPSVLFVCVHNAGRSQMAAGYLQHLGQGQIEVRSAGSVPGDAINPIFPGKHYEDWALEDPAGQGIEAVRRIRDEIRRRVQTLIDELLPVNDAESSTP